jgi:hypothetical protein
MTLLPEPATDGEATWQASANQVAGFYAAVYPGANQHAAWERDASVAFRQVQTG